MLANRIIASGSAGSGGYVDDYVTPYAVWSAEKKLISGYSGQAIRVRRSSDNTEQDIGFSGDLLDTAALLSFTGANSGYVTKIYQQVAALTGADLVQATAAAQPRIVNAGTLEADYAWHDGSDDFLRATLPAGGMASAQATLFTRIRINNTNSNGQYGYSIDVGYNNGSVKGFALYCDQRSVGSGTPGIVSAMSGGSSGPYMQRAFADATRNGKGATHLFTARFDLAVSATDDTALHLYMDGTDTSQATPSTGDPTGTFNYTSVTTGSDTSTNRSQCGLHSLVLVASDALASRANIEAVL